MKHLSANRNLGYTIQPVLFANIYFKWKFSDPTRVNWKNHVTHLGSFNWLWVVWLNTYEFWEKRGGVVGGYRGKRKVGQKWRQENGKYHPSVYELKKSIEQDGMQYPIPVMMKPNEKWMKYGGMYQSEQRLQFFSGMARIRYAMLNDYTSIDAIVSEDRDILLDLQKTMKTMKGNVKKYTI